MQHLTKYLICYLNMPWRLFSFWSFGNGPKGQVIYGNFWILSSSLKEEQEKGNYELKYFWTESIHWCSISPTFFFIIPIFFFNFDSNSSLFNKCSSNAKIWIHFSHSWKPQHFLLYVHQISLSCLYGTFLLNSDMERESKPETLPLLSLWSHLRGALLNLSVKEDDECMQLVECEL